MNNPCVLGGAIRTVQNSTDALADIFTSLAGATTDTGLIAATDKLEIEIERLRVALILLRYEIGSQSGAQA